jgi:hypothetical protein
MMLEFALSLFPFFVEHLIDWKTYCKCWYNKASSPHVSCRQVGNGRNPDHICRTIGLAGQPPPVRGHHSLARATIPLGSHHSPYSLGRPAHRETTSIGRPPSRRRQYLPAGDSPFLWEAILSSRKQSFPTGVGPLQTEAVVPACRRRPLPQSLATGGCLLQQNAAVSSSMCRRQPPF